MEAGSYRLEIPKRSSSISYTLYLFTQDFDWGSVTVTWQDNKNFTVTHTPGSNFISTYNTKLDSWQYGSFKDNYGSLSGYSGSGTITHGFDNVGYVPLVIKVYSSFFGWKSLNGGLFSIKPAQPIISSTIVDKNSATFKLSLVSTSKQGDDILVQQKSGSTWKTIKTVPVTLNLNTIKVTGLKSNTSYSLRLVGRVRAKNGYPELIGVANNKNIRTALSTKPSIKSIKVTKTKSKYVAGKYYPGHWTGNYKTWIKGYYTKAHYSNTYKVTVILKKKATGSKGLWVDGKFIKGTGTKFTGTIGFTSTSKMVGKKRNIVVKSFMDPSYGGFSPSVSKKVKLNK